MPPSTKRRRLDPDQPESITFDPSARQEYLTGFHKRKQARFQHARDTAAKRDKEEKVRERKQLREQRKEDLERHVQEVNAELGKQEENVLDGEESLDDGEEWDGIEEDTAAIEKMPEDEEYVDEDKYTTVTVEAMDGRNNQPESDQDDDEEGETVEARAGEPVNGDAKAKTGVKKRPWSKDGQTKQKKKKFRYESKAERQATRQKQKVKNHKAKLRRTGD